ncbi:hypothetical protein HZC32_00415 [Candidatus Woesearchaeota archaeon]|nr:hypothetical protein [Candidatus Woesearchaeota archaeon]
MEYKLTEQHITELLDEINGIRSFDELIPILFKDSRILVLFRLQACEDRRDFSRVLGKSLNTIANLERGNKKIKTWKKCNEYVKKLKNNYKLHFKKDDILDSYRMWIRKDADNRTNRAKQIAYMGGEAAAKQLSGSERFIRSQKAGLQAVKFGAGVHGQKDKWMSWSKKGLRIAGRKMTLGPFGERMSNELEANVARRLIANLILL